MKHLAKLFLYGVLACGTTLVTGQANAALLINVDTEGCHTNVAINNAIGQSFRVNAATSLEKIEIWIKPELYYTTSYAMELYEGEGTSGALLGTSATTMTLGSQSDGTPSGFQAFSFTDLGLVLQDSHAYTFRLVRISQYSGAFSHCGNVYPDGNEYWLGYSSDSSHDVAFRLYGTQASAPGARALQLSSSTGSYVDVGSLSIPENFTIEAWVKPESAGTQMILTKDYGCVSANQFRLQLEPTNKAAFMMSDGAAADGGLWSASLSYKLQSSSALPFSAWSHLAVTKSGNVFTLYVNGTAEATYTTSVNLLHSGTQPFQMGSRVGCSGTAPDFTFNGLIDEVRVWSVARTQADIVANMSSPLFSPNPAWPDLKGYWRLDDGSGTVARDEKNVYPGTLVNGPVWFIAN